MDSKTISKNSSLREIRDQAYSVRSHYLKSRNTGTNVSLTAVRSVLDTVSYLTVGADVVANGVDPVSASGRVFSWLDGISAKAGDKQMCAVLLGAFQRAVETLKRETELED